VCRSLVWHRPAVGGLSAGNATDNRADTIIVRPAGFDRSGVTSRMKLSMILGILLVGIFIFVLPVPHTISIRDTLLLCLLGMFGYLAWRARPWPAWWRELRLPLSLYLILTLWLFVVALLISQETAWSLDEIRGQWLKATAAWVAGMLVALVTQTQERLVRPLFLVIFLALLLHVLYLDFEALLALVNGGHIARRTGGLTGGADRINYLTNILFAFLLTELLSRFGRRHGYLPGGYGLLGVVLAVVLFSAYVAQLRNGALPLVFMGILFIGMLYRQNRSRIGKPALAAVSVLIMIGIALSAYLVTVSDKRWRDFRETIPIALDTQTHKAWLDWEKYPRPLLPSGEPVRHSNYVRIAWLKEGSLLVLENPLGVGYGREAFEVGLRQKYGEGRGYTHSGILDLAIGAGIPGAALWLVFLGGLFYAAWRRSAVSGNYHSLLLMFLITDFGSRMFIDSIIRDHMLEQFLFLVGLASVMMCLERGNMDGQFVTRS
jgi:O-antigen ligase